MGTTVNITVKENFKALDIINDAIKKMEMVTDAFDLYKTDSEVSKINKNSEKKSIYVSNEFKRLLNLCFNLNKKTFGAFNITIGPLEDLWGFYDDKDNALPDKEQIKTTLEKCTMDNLQIKGNDLVFAVADMELDFNALAKGYAVDEAVTVLKESGISQAIVDAGGDVYCIGDNNGQGWHVGVRDPEKKNNIVGFFTISNKAAATSGGYEKFITIKDKEYPHIIDPRTGYPVDSNVVSATVVASKCAIADAFATAFFVLFPQESMKIVESDPDIESIVIAKENNSFKYYVSSGLKDNFKLIGVRNQRPETRNQNG
jgi:thiamine biosynthesis lipoprotein